MSEYLLSFLNSIEFKNYKKLEKIDKNTEKLIRKLAQNRGMWYPLSGTDIFEILDYKSEQWGTMYLKRLFVSSNMIIINIGKCNRCCVDIFACSNMGSITINRQHVDGCNPYDGSPDWNLDLYLHLENLGFKNKASVIERLFQNFFYHSENYGIWYGMIDRCNNPTSTAYRWYGARGIKVCDRWLKSKVFFNYDMGKRPDNLQIDRIDNDGNYEPGNCRWVTAKVNMSNTSRNPKYRQTKKFNKYLEKRLDKIEIADIRKQAHQEVRKYKGYYGEVEYDYEGKIFHGEVIGLKDVITFQGKNVTELEKAFKDSINDYLKWCHEER